jgi:hypothetical protein
VNLRVIRRDCERNHCNIPFACRSLLPDMARIEMSASLGSIRRPREVDSIHRLVHAARPPDLPPVYVPVAMKFKNTPN